MQEMPIDSSLAFTAQLELRPALSQLDGTNWRAGLLKAWYAQDEVKSFWQFAKQWDAGVTIICSA